LARERVAERPEMQRQEKRERHARDPMDGKGPPGGMAAGAEVVLHLRQLKTARTARKPHPASASPSTSTVTSSPRARQSKVSARTVRSPMGAGTATAATKSA